MTLEREELSGVSTTVLNGSKRQNSMQKDF